MKIFKYPIQTTDHQRIDMPIGAEILCVQVQSGQPCIWAKVDPSQPTESRGIYVHGTGHDVADDASKYIGTYQLTSILVFHVFEQAL